MDSKIPRGHSALGVVEHLSRKENDDKYFEETSSKGRISDRVLLGRPRLWSGASRRRTGIVCEEPVEGGGEDREGVRLNMVAIPLMTCPAHQRGYSHQPGSPPHNHLCRYVSQHHFSSVALLVAMAMDGWISTKGGEGRRARWAVPTDGFGGFVREVYAGALLGFSMAEEVYRSVLAYSDSGACFVVGSCALTAPRRRRR